MKAGRSLKFVALLICLLGAARSQIMYAGNGVIAGTGASITDLTPLPEAPHLQRVMSFLNRLAPYEPTLVRLMREFHGPDSRDPRIIKFKKTSYRCAEKDSPDQEVRAIFNGDINFVILCAGYDVLDENTQVATILHELFHYVLKRVSHQLLSGEELWVVSLEKEILLPMLNGDEAAFVTGARQLSELFDRDIPALFLYVSSQEVLGEPISIPMFDDDVISFAMPRNFLNDTYIVPHFLAEHLSLLWQSAPHYRSAQLFHRSAPSANLRAVSSLAFGQDANGRIKVDRVVSTLESERIVPLAQTTEIFRQFFERYRSTAHRNWISDGKYFYFFE